MIFFFLLGQITTGVNISEGRREKKKEMFKLIVPNMNSISYCRICFSAL